MKIGRSPVILALNKWRPPLARIIARGSLDLDYIRARSASV